MSYDTAQTFQAPYRHYEYTATAFFFNLGILISMISWWYIGAEIKTTISATWPECNWALAEVSMPQEQAGTEGSYS